MRIGSLVKVSRMNPGDNEWHVPDGSIAGTIIAIEEDDSVDYTRVNSVTIRWNDGRVETSALQGEDETGCWGIADVTPELYANLYLHDRVWGGPEEGGWFYDTYTPVDGEWIDNPPAYGLFPNKEKAEEASFALTQWCDRENSNRSPPSSVASEGHFVVWLESWPAEPMPSRRPHYG